MTRVGKEVCLYLVCIAHPLMNSTQEFTKSFLIEEGRFVVPGRGPGMGGGAKEARGGASSVRYCI